MELANENWDVSENELDELYQQVSAVETFLNGEAGTVAEPTSGELAAMMDYLKHKDVWLDDAVKLDYLETRGETAYYAMPIPLHVFPSIGSTIDRVEVYLVFNPGSSEDSPIVHDMFPNPEWVNLVSRTVHFR